MTDTRQTQTNASDGPNPDRIRAEPAPLAAPNDLHDVGAGDLNAPTPAASANELEDVSEFAVNTNAYVTEYIKFSDAKAGAILSFATIVVGAVASSGLASLRLLQSHSELALQIGVATLVSSLVSAVVVGVNCIWALSPRTPKASSLRSFPDIASMSATDYEAALRRLDRQGTVREYARHTHTLSVIAGKKFKVIGAATNALVCMMLFVAAYVIVVGATSLVADNYERPKTVSVLPGTR